MLDSPGHHNYDDCASFHYEHGCPHHEHDTAAIDNNRRAHDNFARFHNFYRGEHDNDVLQHYHNLFHHDDVAPVDYDECATCSGLRPRLARVLRNL